ncbi:MAG TPA: DUF456 domain-containing protein, partial [Longimicrobiales bacterium]|nr:DUF456 domain-containing protein [Longimicrobiales bacterium]
MLSILGVLIMGIALFLTPLGIPGLWVMVGVLAIGAIAGDVGFLVIVTCLVIALAAELLEFLIVQKLNVRYGGSRLAFWGAIFGGVAGVIIGMPIPVIGSLIAGFLGTFAGAMAATLYETKRFDSAARVGWGVLIGRMWAAATKVAAGVVIFVLGSAALLL